MATASEQPLISPCDAEPTTWPTIQPAEPRQRQYFCCGRRCGCCPPYIVLALLAGVMLYFFGFTALNILFFLVTFLYAFCGCPLISFYMYTRCWECPPWHWVTNIYIKLAYLVYQSLLLSRQTPTASEDMPVDEIRPKEQLEKFAIEYALNIQVPKKTQEEFTKLNISSTNITQVLEENLSRLPLIDNFEAFRDGEDPVAYVMAQLGSVYPPVYQVWDDKQSDRALTRLCLYGLGAHRIEVEQVSGRKMYVVRTNMLSTLPMRKGFEPYGGDAYFDADWNPIMIADNGLKAPNPDGSPNPVVAQPGDPGWIRAKFRFRSSLLVLVTIVDHLYGIHLQTANLFVTALREQLSADHPLRRFFTPFTFQTISINDTARLNLVQLRSIGPRCWGLTDAGLQLAFSAAPKLLRTGLEVSTEDGGPILDREEYVEYQKRKGIDTEYYRQSAELSCVMKKFLRTYMEYYYATPADVLADAELQALVAQFTYQQEFVTPGDVLTKVASNQTPVGDILAGAPDSLVAGLVCSNAGSSPKPKTPPVQDVQKAYETILSVLTNFMFLVTAGHEQVGAVEVYMQDVSFCASKWAPGALIGTKQTATCQALLMSFTSTPMPKLVGEDWTHLFLEATKVPTAVSKTPKQAFALFQRELIAMSKRCDAYNEAASTRQFPESFPLYTLNPKLLETSISV